MAENSFKLISNYKPAGDQPVAIDTLTKNFLNGSKKQQTLLGVTGSGKTYTVANLVKKLGKKTLVLAPNKTLAAQLYAEFKDFFPENAVEYFVSYYDYYRPEAYMPSSDTYIEKDSSVNDEIDKLRHSATRSLLEREDVIVVSSVSCIYGLGSPEEYEAQKLTLFKGHELNREEFLKSLVEVQYKRNDMDFIRGTFRVRGDIVEIFPAHEDAKVIAIEFFGDTIDAIFIKDPLRGKVLNSLNKVVIYPSSHYVVGKDIMKRAMETIKVELRSRLAELKAQNKLVEEQRLEQRTMLDLEMMEEVGFCSGIENYSRHLTGMKAGEPPPTLIDFFKKDFLMVIDESHITVPQVGGMYKGDRARKMNLVEHGFRLPSALDNRPLNFEEFETKLDLVLYVSATPSDYEIKKSDGEFVEQIIRPTGLIDPTVEVRDAKTQVDDILEETKKVIKNKGRVLITTLTKKLSEELTQYFKQNGIKVKYLHSDINSIERIEIIRELRLGEVDVLVGINLLREGLDIPEVELVGILDADKEGFLRSTRSLIQTIGRAARNANGRVILYAYTTTKSIQEALTETNRRRKIQHDFNVKHNITPTTVGKKISGGIIDTLKMSKKKGKEDTPQEKINIDNINLRDIDKNMAKLKELMKKAAQNLEFEKAAQIRDEIKALNEMKLLL